MVKDILYRKELKYTAIMNRNMMGTIFERRGFHEFKRIFKLNEQMTPKMEFEIKIKLEINRYLGNLDLPMKLSDFVYYNFMRFRSYFSKHSKQNKTKLIPVIIYITCLTHHIFITKDKIIECANSTRKAFHTTLKSVLQYDKALQCLIASDTFRIKYILHVFNGLSNAFNFSARVMHKAMEIIPYFYRKYRTTMSNKNIIVCLYLIIARTHKDLMGIPYKQIASFLGVHQCMISRMKKVIFN